MGLGVIKEWHCIEHGEFEASHPICPADGCQSTSVVREFRTAPKTSSRMVRQHDAGMKRTSDMYHINNFRTARAGEASHGGQTAPAGQGVLWGDDCRKVFGKTFGEMAQVAARPLTVQPRNQNAAPLTIKENSGMVGAMSESPGLAKRRLPKPGELARHKSDTKSEGAAKQLTA